jgi:phospholipase/carboxylesterase
MDRRRFGALAGGFVASVAFGDACRLRGEARHSADAQLTARPDPRVKTTARGTVTLGLGAPRDAILRIPAAAPARPMPLLVLLHGAGGSAAGIIRRFEAAIDASAVAVLAPDSRGGTWDAIRGDFGPDVGFLDRALEQVFRTVAVDPARLAVGGFSDGATYALSLGLVNGELFRRIAAFSPGFVVEAAPRGKPRVFVSHGTADEILPIDRCSRVIVPALKRHGYDVTYREFAGGHAVPGHVAEEGLSWVAGRSG